MGDMNETSGLHAIVVSEDFLRRNRWAALLRSHGFQTATCSGTFVAKGCPRLDGDMCPLREWAHVGIVEVPPDATTELYGGTPERFCTTLPDDERTVLIHRSPPGSDGYEGRRVLVHPVTDDDLIRSARAAARII